MAFIKDIMSSSISSYDRGFHKQSEVEFVDYSMVMQSADTLMIQNAAADEGDAEEEGMSKLTCSHSRQGRVG